MLSFTIKRIVSGLVLVFAVSTLAFFLMSFAGGDIARVLLGENATPEQMAAKNAQLGLDSPVIVRYGEWLSHAVHGDFGSSWFSGVPVLETLQTRFPVTLSLVLVTVLCTAVIGTVLGMLAALRGGLVDRAVQVLAIIGDALPGFLIALFLVIFFAINLHLLPATGYTSPQISPGAWIIGLILPVTALTLGTVAGAAQQIRGAAIDVLHQDYIRTLRSRRLPQRVILIHVLRNAAPPGLTTLSLQFIGLLGGAVAVERVFALPGIGTMAVDATVQGDIPSILGLVVLLVVVVVIVNLLFDLLAALLNPKVRIS